MMMTWSLIVLPMIRMSVTYVLVITVHVRIVQALQMDLLLRMNVVHVMLIAPMTVYRIVLVRGVVAWN